MYFFFYNRTLILLHNALKLSRESWELTFTPPSTPPSNLATLSYFSKPFLKCSFKQFSNQRGYRQEYKLLYICNVHLSGAAFYIKVNINLCVSSTPKMISFVRFKTPTTQFFASFVLYLLHVKFVK